MKIKKMFRLGLQIFANPKLTGGTHELQERYASTIIKLVRKRNVLRNYFKRDYEGSPVAGAVKIPVRDTDVTVGTYNVLSGGTLTQSATSYKTVTINADKYMNELIDGHEADAVPDNVIAQRVESGSYSLASDTEAEAVSALMDGGTELTAKAISKTDAFDTINEVVGDLLKIGVEIEDIVIGISVDTETKLLGDARFSNTASAVGNDKIATGVVGRIRGADVVVVPKLPSNVNFFVGGTPWMQTGDEWNVMPNIKDLHNNHIGASALQARWATFSTITRAECVLIHVATATV